MTDKEKLVELLCRRPDLLQGCDYPIRDCHRCHALADHLISNGVTVNGREIERLKDETANLCIAINTLEEINRDLILRIEESKQKWVGVEEALPEDCTEVLVWARSYVNIGWIDGGVWRGDFVNDYEGDVTHWMPVPEPPAEEVDHE